MAEKRNRRFALRLSVAELKMVTTLAMEAGVSDSDIVRMCVRKVFSERAEKIVTRNKIRS